ncbi:uncharacterized protein LOC122355255 isoform X2 [Puntigrus tetrazona]|uniref:uncharacterized protein LOC122355255 isoform X2 n=1 Tax=Puntigrus tetrazona TaxID=1606681 RepID=UPI001C8AC593|nr:uncharacterized protein LOC122355255 isoform X2 [Puntigrus tetrazona]
MTSAKQDFSLVVLILLLHVSDSLTLNYVSVNCTNICALRETSVHLKCSYNSNITPVFWFSEKQSKNWRNDNEPEDLTLDSDYSGRVKHEIFSGSSTLTISDLRETDAGEYQLMFVDGGVKHLSSAAVSLTVTDLQVRKNSTSIDARGRRFEILTCDTSCDLTSRPQNFYWKRNGRYLLDINSRRIAVYPQSSGSYSCFLTADLLNSSSPVCVFQSSCWDVTYTSRRVCAVVGSTVEISSTYSHPPGHTVRKKFWHYGPSGDFKDLLKESQFAGRVEYVENKLRIKDLKISDSGVYRFRIITKLNGQYSGSPGVILTVTGTQMKRSQVFLSERQEGILSCSANCTVNKNTSYIWYKNRRQVTDGFTKDNKLYLDSVSSEELQQYSCAVGDSVSSGSSTALLSAAIILSVLLILLLIGVLWCRRRKNNSSQKHEDRMESGQDSAVLYENATGLSTVCTQQDHMKDQDVHYSAIRFKKQSKTKNTSSAPTAVQSTTDDVHYAAVKFSRTPA